VKIRRRTTSPLEKKAHRGFRGYPVATIAFYGPTDDFASKVAVGIVLHKGDEPTELRRWHAKETDVRKDAAIQAEILSFITEQGVSSVVMTDGLIGCPHEEGVDYPQGSSCPECPYWAGRDRFSKERTH
jgi:hypothetical protein